MRRLSDEEKRRRGTLQPCRVRDTPASAGCEPQDYYSWLEGLSALAQQEGRRFLEHGIPGNREAFRVYLEHLADGERRYPLRNAPMDEKIRQSERGIKLLDAARVRWR
jgi:hypothetical protein